MEAKDPQPWEREDRRFRWSLGVAAACVLVAVSSGVITGSDGPAAYAVAQSIVENGDLTVSPELGFPGRGGNTYASHGFGLPLVAVPFYAISLPVARAASQPEISTGAVSLVMPIVGGLLVIALFRLTRRLGAKRSTSALVAVGAVGGTFLLPYVKDFYSEPLATLFLVVAIERLLANRLLASGAALTAAGITRPQLFLVSPLFLWRAYAQDGRRGLLREAVPVVGGIGVTLSYNVARFSDPLQFDPLQGGVRPGGLPTGIAGLLFYPTKSVFLFLPLVVLVPFALWWLRRRNTSAFWLLSGNLVIGFVIAAAWPAWDGGWTWGPRLLLPAVIPALAALGVWLENGGPARFRVAAALAILGLLVSLPGVAVSTRAQLRSHPPAHGPSIWRQYALLPHAITDTIAHPTSDRPEDRSLDFWQVRALRIFGPPAATLLAVTGTLLLAGVATLAWSRRGGTAKAETTLGGALPTE
jgi:hypothetical protein